MSLDMLDVPIDIYPVITYYVTTLRVEFVGRGSEEQLPII